IKFYLLYKYQNISKVNYILRNIPIKFDGKLYKQLKNIKKLILRAMIPFPMNHLQIQQSELATRYGGIACRNIKQLTCAAYLARFSATNQSAKAYQIATNFLYEYNKINQSNINQYYITEYINLLSSKNKVIKIYDVTYTQKKLLDNIDRSNYDSLMNYGDN